jgi:hypothetical protein
MTTVEDIQGISITLTRLLELLEVEEDEDDYVIRKSTGYAFKKTMSIVLEAHSIMGNTFPRASASTDYEGGVRLTWKKVDSERIVRLFCPANSEQPMDVYYSTDTDYGIEDVISVLTLVHRLEWFNEE